MIGTGDFAHISQGIFIVNLYGLRLKMIVQSLNNHNRAKFCFGFFICKKNQNINNEQKKRIKWTIIKCFAVSDLEFSIQITTKMKRLFSFTLCIHDTDDKKRREKKSSMRSISFEIMIGSVKTHTQNIHVLLRDQTHLMQ